MCTFTLTQNRYTTESTDGRFCDIEEEPRLRGLMMRRIQMNIDVQCLTSNGRPHTSPLGLEGVHVLNGDISLLATIPCSRISPSCQHFMSGVTIIMSWTSRLMTFKNFTQFCISLDQTNMLGRISRSESTSYYKNWCLLYLKVNKATLYEISDGDFVWPSETWRSDVEYTLKFQRYIVLYRQVLFRWIVTQQQWGFGVQCNIFWIMLFIKVGFTLNWHAWKVWQLV